ncbi:energy-coupling factor transport system permease protein [Clostridium tetanomorphum]|uniref:Energy-coupling factor transporter transmembrane protein EcfT n=1 Tax=Clostridium tetanomorphum TaxID=1553 RepID=A0A923J1Y7_CLOTT|nr:energy-coupling factor transporter transmembrane component T [Clostridium tetanomorphum]KAJ52363.1 ABC transporter permease [Clostridium tetanomorphum DSM 665]MBC2397883.1 energy-coupling factor transporter transmembrane protein EcfT [Clostridium tetanomorphum]MBP1864802.1 energy-coupling factor transport system permease protein [Clostridium tetanomorphum]NRS83978.1 energy-coupling factor transport system permease protein [Clostridium tetanomorphum]NRZ97196.1 energy-coupling factor transpor
MRNEFAEVESKESIFNYLDVRTKMIMLVCFAVIGMVLSGWKALFTIFLFVWIIVIVSKVSLRKVKVLIILNLLTVWGIIWIQAIFYEAYPRTPLLYILPPMVVEPSTPIIGGLWEGIAIYYEGFVHGMTQSLRMVIPMTFGMLIFWTEDPIRILIGLNKLKLPYTISFMVMTCLRFIPITFSEVKVTVNSQKLRKYKPFDAKGVIFLYGIYRTVIQTLVPLLSNCIRKSMNMARSADSRAFRAYDERTQLRKIEMKIFDKIIITLFFLLTIGIILCKLLAYCSNARIYYNNRLLPIYWFTHKYL